jgi:LuxR family transcriptional regulator, maltose regulon positive regulatory protein
LRVVAHRTGRALDDGLTMTAADWTGSLERADEADPELIGSKLVRPRVPASYVARPHVDQLLEADSRKLLTVVSAGPGWGKTLAAAHWAATRSPTAPVAWLTLDDGDNRLDRFGSYLLASIRTTGIAEPATGLVRSTTRVDGEDEHVRRLILGLTRLPVPVPVTVVLDDFQTIHDRAVLSCVEKVLRHRLENVRLVLLTRVDPALPLQRLRAADDLAVVRAADLAFTAADASALLAGHGVPVGDGESDLLVARTEGWPVGLRLAALFLESASPRRGAADFAGDDQSVTGYLAEEVLRGLAPDVRRFLLRTSIVEHVSSDLAQALTGQSQGQRHLENLEHSNAFVVGLGPGREWFRYHALLRETLQHRLQVEEPEAVPLLHRRAAEWFAEHDRPVEALGHAADAADWSLVARLVVTRALPLLVSIDRGALGQALARIPPPRFSDGPELALCGAARVFLTGRFDDMEPHLRLAERQLAASAPEAHTGARVALRLLRLPVHRARGELDKVAQETTEALEILSAQGRTLPSVDAFRAIALSNLGTALLWSGRPEEAQVRLREALVALEGTRLGVTQVNTLAHLGLAATAAGRLQIGHDYASRAVEITDSRGWTPLIQVATAYLALAAVQLRRDDVAGAQQLLEQAEAAAAGEPAPRVAVALARARLDASLGRTDVAQDRLARLRTEDRTWASLPFLSRWLTITEAEVDLASGDPVGALARIEATTADHGPPYAAERICLARALVETGQPREAQERLAPLLDGAGQGQLVEAWLVTAYAADAMRQDYRATEALGEALRIAEVDGVRRPFVVLGGERLLRLLARLAETGSAHADRATGLAAYLRGQAPQDGHRGGAEQLTDRELMVLRLLPTMMTNAEIAAQLYVSVNTVKAHLKRIYRKLGVETRRDAAHSAHDLGLLAVSEHAEPP